MVSNDFHDCRLGAFSCPPRTACLPRTSVRRAPRNARPDLFSPD